MKKCGFTMVVLALAWAGCSGGDDPPPVEDGGGGGDMDSGGGGDVDGGGGDVDSGGGGGDDGGGGGDDGGAGDMCGDFMCTAAECSGGTCTPDCGATCTPGGGCGDGTCDSGETCLTCPADCEMDCGDGCCLIDEDCESCDMDCETVESCDPSACGNGQCNYGLSETCLNCADCFGLCDCGNDSCDDPETPANCPWDCRG